MVSSVGDIEQLRREIIDAGAISARDKNLLLPSSDLTMIARSFQAFLVILENVYESIWLLINLKWRILDVYIESNDIYRV